MDGMGMGEGDGGMRQLEGDRALAAIQYTHGHMVFTLHYLFWLATYRCGDLEECVFVDLRFLAVDLIP
jgi:hypothetical protein